ncbi:AraC family transcriptional regulator [Niabella drilacis]|uniref:AraC-type DNA-binding protein n=1 Tax=Niabella drilacis (strain DSM 25811 / CCM 8410 / CCUG 62505 / LMG 26954 / E90) TaxID=1285928 RepID=A0A1G6YVT8_NIADE|nr:AraC family transcriptional regulator [Niabella drilacis]SDD93747.1 AraC-type DNA-binding protein [Niabella drilacis]
MQTLWVSMSILRNIILGAARTTEALKKICAQGNISVSDLDNHDMKLSLEQNCALMDAALQISGDPDLGLHIGERTTVNVLGITGHLMESSKDLLTALHHLQEYTTSFTRLYYFGSELNGSEVVYRCEPIAVWNDLSPETARQSVDIAFSGTLHILRLLTGFHIQPLQVWYRYARIRDTTEHQRIFKCQPLFNKPANALVFSLKDLQHSILGYNRELNDVFIKMLYQKLHQENHSFIQQLRTLILELSTPSFPGIEEVAARLHLTVRTLQRKLQEENTSFRAETESIRKEIACNLLSAKNLTVAEIADRLGYTDKAAFQRSFKQWTGVTPSSYRTSETTNK